MKANAKFVFGFAGIAAAFAALAAIFSRGASTPKAGPQVQPAAGDLVNNWGTTPVPLRQLFVAMEKACGVPGSARFFAIVAARESSFVPIAHNDSEGETDASRRAYDNNVKKKPKLVHGGGAREFGSGGLFGQLAPYFLWSATAELKDKAPLLAKPPTAIYDPRLAAFGAAVLLRRIITLYRVDDLADARVGWAAVGLLSAGRGNSDYKAVRGRFFESADKLGIDVNLLPSPLKAGAWAGPQAAYDIIMAAPIS